METIGTHTFIYLAPAMAHVIPHASVSEGDVVEFAAELETRLSVKAPGDEREETACPN